MNYDETELLRILRDIEGIIENTIFDEIIFGADFNWDKSRNNGFVACMDRWVEKTGLLDVWDSFPISYTHIHTDMKSVSTLDRFLVSPGLLEHIEDAGVIHLGDNPSRHSPIMLKVNLQGITAVKRTPKASLPKRPAWYKADEAQVNTYTFLLDEKLRNLTSPEELSCRDPLCTNEDHIKARDSFLLDILIAMIETSHETVPLGGGKKGKYDPDKNCIVEKTIPGWREEIEPLRQDSLFWHFLWQQSNRPNSGSLFEVMKHVRNKYHYAVRKCKAKAEKVNLEKLFEAAKSGDVNLLKEMKAVKGGEKSQNIPTDNIEGANGSEEISDKFKQVYEALYNSAESADDVNFIKFKLREVISHESTHEVNKVTMESVKEACTRMKPGKSDVTGSYTSDLLLHGPDMLFEFLARIFRSFYIHGNVTLELLSCAFIPLFKGGLKNPNRSDSYRAIAGSSQILKLLDNLIILLWGDQLATDALQFGFKKQTSTTQCSWLIMEVASYFLRQGTPVIVTLLDCSKAFDMCRFSTLFQKLLDRNFPPIVIRLLIFVYEEQEGCVVWDGVRSDSFRITNGTRQGSVLSPVLFSVYLDNLLQELRIQGVGCHMGGVWVGAAGYADDIILLAPSRAAMQKMLKVCEVYASSHNLCFSTDPMPSKSKTKCIFMCGYGNPVLPVPLRLSGQDLPWVEHGTHLGHELHQLGNMDMDISMKRAEFIESSVQIRETFNFARPEEILKAVNVYCSHFYGSMLWDLYGNKANQLFNSWSTCVKLAWDIPRSTHTYIVEDVLAKDFFTVKQQLVGRFVDFFQKLLKSPSSEIRVVANMAGRCAQSTTGGNLHKIQLETGLDPWQVSGWKFKESIGRSRVTRQDAFRVQYLRKLLDARTEIRSRAEDSQEVDVLINSLCSS